MTTIPIRRSMNTKGIVTTFAIGLAAAYVYDKHISKRVGG